VSFKKEFQQTGAGMDSQPGSRSQHSALFTAAAGQINTTAQFTTPIRNVTIAPEAIGVMGILFKPFVLALCTLAASPLAMGNVWSLSSQTSR
jgi:hypothetical protein